MAKDILALSTGTEIIYLLFLFQPNFHHLVGNFYFISTGLTHLKVVSNYFEDETLQDFKVYFRMSGVYTVSPSLFLTPNETNKQSCILNCFVWDKKTVNYCDMHVCEYFLCILDILWFSILWS